MDVWIDGVSFFSSVNSSNFENKKTSFLSESSKLLNYFECGVNNVQHEKKFEKDIKGDQILDENGKPKFYFELKPQSKAKSDIEIDGTSNGTGLVKKISFTKSDRTFESIKFNMQNRDLFVVY